MPRTRRIHYTEDDPETRRNLMAMDPKSHATNQRVTMPYYAGEEMVAGLWVGTIYGQFTRAVPAQRPGKK